MENKIEYLRIRIQKQIKDYIKINKKRSVDPIDYIVKTIKLNSIKTMTDLLVRINNNENVKIERLNRRVLDINKDCQICLNRVVNCVLKPCGHSVCCDSCIKYIISKYNGCVVCKYKVTEIEIIKKFKNKDNYEDLIKDIENIENIEVILDILSSN